MEGFGPEKLLLILVAVLLLFGAKRIPEIAGSFGKGIREFKRQINGADDGGAPAQLSPPTLDEPLPRRTDPATDEDRSPKRLI